jgi:glutamate-5-semialdehyde dehydrogenase
MKSSSSEVLRKGENAKAAAKKLASLNTATKNKALLAIASALVSRQAEILKANKLDYDESKKAGMSISMLDRLLLTSERIRGIAKDVETVAALPDPVGEIMEERTLPNRLKLSKVRVPLGVIGAIYESRPNVTVDISALCLKAGNAVVLRGGKESLRSNLALARLIQETAYAAGIPRGAVEFIQSTDKALVDEMLQMRGIIDLIIPRGGAGLIKHVSENAAMAVVSGGIGVCHTYVDKDADIKKAVAIVYNAKVQRPTVCNALDTILVHKDIAAEFLPLIGRELSGAGVQIHCDPTSLQVLKRIKGLKCSPAAKSDWGREFLALICAVKTVESLDAALEHIDQYGSGHSEAIVSENKKASERFLKEVDAACVYSNASTRFTDGAQFGMGAEIGISTQKFHARGPMALREITTYKWVIRGNGQVRP